MEEELHFHFSRPLARAGVLRIFDAMGREVMEVALPAGQQEGQVRLSAPPGIYFYEMENGVGGKCSGELVKK